MKHLLFIICIFFLSTVNAQNKGFATVSFGLDFPKKADPAISVFFSGNHEVLRDLALGISGGVVKFPRADRLYFPVAANITIMPGNKSTVSPLIILQPGYGFYNRSESSGPFNFETKGGFTFYGGAGVLLPAGPVKVHFTGGIGYYTFETNWTKDGVTTGAIRLGLMFR